MTQTFPRAAGEVGRARRMVGSCLIAWGLGAKRRAVELVVSELMTNAVLHGEGAIELRVTAAGDLVRVEVRDNGGGRPRTRPVQLSGPHMGGWGLRLVDRLADAWGTDTIDGHSRVWAERTIGQRCEAE